MGRQAFGFEEDLVAFFIGKAVDLVFDTGAITRAYAFDFAREHGAAVKAAADDGVRLGVGMRHPARHLLRVRHRVAHKAEYRHGFVRCVAAGHAVARLLAAQGKIDAAPVYARWCASFQAALRQLQLFQAGRQRHRWWIACPARLVVLQADMDAAV